MRLLLSVSVLLVLCTHATAHQAIGGQPAKQVARFDFTRPEQVREWNPDHDVARIETSSEGMLVRIDGSDPYISGPKRDFTAGQPLWLAIRLRSDEGGMAQVFYYTAGAREEDSVRFAVRPGVWDEIRVPVPPLAPQTRFRIDPPGSSDACVISALWFEPRSKIDEPAWLRPGSSPIARTQVVKSADLLLRHGKALGSWSLTVSGAPIAMGNDRPLVGYQIGSKTRWIDVGKAGRTSSLPIRTKSGVGLGVRTRFTDPDGADWEISQDFIPAKLPNAIDVITRVTVSKARSVVNLPLLVLHPGLGSFGKTKGQALFCGLEYLDDEPSSSEADLIGPESDRRVPDTLKITIPLMAIQASDRYVGVIWEKSPRIAALFDTPDRIFQSGAHVMGLLFPGSNGADRQDGALLPYRGTVLEAGQPLVSRGTIIGGKGKNVIPAVQQYVALRGLPPVPHVGVNRDDYIAQASAGWLDSRIREGAMFRHAWPGAFGVGPAGDASIYTEWLAENAKDASLVGRLRDVSKQALEQVGLSDYYGSGVSHVRFPAAPLLHGYVEENIGRAEQLARSLLKRFEMDGSVAYHPSRGGLDYGKTHFAKDANGLTSQVVLSLLEAAVFCGDRELIRAGLDRLRALDRFADTVPRGAQTWEIALHTPDILASAYLVRAYTLGYELTGEARFLELARYWAWTGVPFIYLTRPSDRDIGMYATIPVLGATQWKAPVWLGLPVQWCGLVYSDALYRLLPHDPSGPWKRIADGITASGIQQAWPAGTQAKSRASALDRQGLLPDSLSPRSQTRNDAAINPGTLQASAIRLFGGPEMYGFRTFRKSGIMVHAPGAISDAVEIGRSVRFSVRGWVEADYRILLLGVPEGTRVKVDGKEEVGTGRDDRTGRLILSVRGRPKIEVNLPSVGR